MLIGSNPKKNEDPVALMEATPDIEFGHGVSVFPAMWKFCRCQKIPWLL